MSGTVGPPPSDEPAEGLIPAEPPPAAGGSALPSPTEQTSPSGATVLAGGAWSAVSLLIPHLYTLVLSIAAARFLGPHLTGVQSFIAWTQASLLGLAGGGFQVAATRFVGAASTNRRDEVRGILRWTWRAQAPWVGLGAVAIAAIALARPDQRTAWLLAGVGFVTAAARAIPLGLLRGRHLWRESSSVGLVAGAVSTLATVGVLSAGAGIVGMFAVDAIVSVVATVVAVGLVRRKAPDLQERVERRPEAGRRVLGYAYASTGQILLMLLVWQRSEFLLLERLSTSAQLAFYSVAFGLVSAPARVLQGAVGAVAPAVAAMDANAEQDRIRQGFARAARLLMLVSLPITAMLLVAGPATVRALYGESFADAASPLLVMAVGVPLAPLYHLGVELLHGFAAVRKIIVALLVAAAVDLIAAAFLVGRWDALGAAWANLLGQTTATLMVIGFARRAIPGVRLRLRRLWRVALVSAGVALAALGAMEMLRGGPDDSVGLLGICVGVLVAGAIGTAISVGVGVIPSGDAQWIAERSGSSRLGRLIAAASRRAAIGRR